MTDIVSVDDIDVVVDEEPPAPAPRGRKGKYDALIEAARQGGEAARKAKKRAPWVIFPKANAEGEREPIVSNATYNSLRKRFGRDSEYHVQNGHYFDIRLASRINTGSTGKSTRGVLWVRQEVE